MFKRENRLAAGVRFNKARNFSISQFTVKIQSNGLLINRFGIVVSKKVDRRAVVRNRIKRIFRTFLSDLNKQMVAGNDILFIIKPEILRKTKEEILSLIKNSLQKVGL